MKPRLRLAAVICATLATACIHAASVHDHYAVLSKLPLGGAGGWDYLNFDAAHRHLFVSRGDRVQVVDVDAHKLVAEIPGTAGVHGIALAPALNLGFTSNGLAASVTVFKLDTLAVVGTVTGTGEKPDAIVFDQASGHVLTFNGKGHSVSVIDPLKQAVIATIALPGKPEFAAVDGAGHAYVNIEDLAHIVQIDTHANTVLNEWKLGTCESPSGLAMDVKHRRLFSVCDNKQMAVTDADNGQQVASLPIGEGPDAVVFDAAEGVAYSSNGESGDITAVKRDSANHYHVAATIPTQPSARTLALDPKLHRLYLSAATVSADKPAEGHHPEMVPDSFTVLTVGRP